MWEENAIKNNLNYSTLGRKLKKKKVAILVSIASN